MTKIIKKLKLENEKEKEVKITRTIPNQCRTEKTQS